MAITSKYVEVGGRMLIKHESDSGKMIRQIETGREYSSAIDTIPCKYSYEESERDVERYSRMEGEDLEA